MMSTYFHSDDTTATVNATGKTFIDYFLPMPIIGELSFEAWGAAEVGRRDLKNGLEDPTMQSWCYWDGHILKRPDGRFQIIASRWDQAQGHDGWLGSKAISAVSDNACGPYIDQGLCWPQSEEGKGHNMIALVLPDGRYAIVTSETRDGDVFVSDSLDGPWELLGQIQVAENEFTRFGAMSNVCVLLRPDGDFQIVPRSGAILLSKTGILGPYQVQGPGIYENLPGMPTSDAANLHYLEDPVVWHSGGLYHIVVNHWNERKAYHLTSLDGISDWRYRGLAYDAASDFLRYTDGTVNRWHKLERFNVLLENGHVTAITLSAMDTPKLEQHGNDGHGSKVIVIPFDGAALDRDLKTASSNR